MIGLQRVVRFGVVPPDQLDDALARSSNGYAGRPSLRDFERHYELLVSCVGTIDPVLNYLLDIKEIDRAARKTLIPAICGACYPESPAHTITPTQALINGMGSFNELLGGVVRSVRLILSPFHSIEMSTSTMQHALLRQRFDFAAAHRLHVPEFSMEENTRRFGKCNNPKGHGHNYQFEPCVRIGLSKEGAGHFTLSQLEQLADEVLIAKFDHMHLNEDTTEFAYPKGVMPTVENIAKVFFEILSTAMKKQGDDAELVSMTVWETDRTSATYPAM